MDIDLPILGDDLPEDEAFAIPDEHHTSDTVQDDESSSAVAAPMQRKKRKPRIIQADYTMELRNKDLLDWSTNYRQNMAEASRHKINYRAATQAKKNAEYWVWGAGIGGIRFPDGTVPPPFDMYHGDNLYELYTGKTRNALAGKKHDRDSGIDEATEGESRRVRARTAEEEDQVGRGGDDEGMFMPEDEEVELPRDAPSALDDQHLFSAMPWNMSASIRGSSQVPRSARPGMPGSHGPSTGAHASLRLPGSRMVSASPLQHRSQPGGLDALSRLDSDGDFDMQGFGLPEQISSDGVYLEPENIGPSVRVRDALSAESGNFLAFISDAISEKRGRVEAQLAAMSDPLQAAAAYDAAADLDEVLFEELLPPAENTKMVACQGLMMVLTLGTGGMLNVRQDNEAEHIGAEIGLSLTEKAMGVVAVTADDEEIEDEQEEGGHFEEQMAAGAGEESETEDERQGQEGQIATEGGDREGSETQDDDIDSLYAD